MKNTTTLKEIESFLDEKLNFAKNEEQEKEYGKNAHQIRPTLSKDGTVCQGSGTIYILNKTLDNFSIGGLNVNKDAVIEYIDIDSIYLERKVNFGKDRNLYVGTDMRKELRERFLGKKLIG